MCLAVPMRIEEINGNIARCGLGGNALDVNISFVEGVKVGDYVIVHAGFAMKALDEEEALETISLINGVLEKTAQAEAE